MKILLCTCIPFWDSWHEGGGVAVYVNNLIPALLSKGHDVSFLSYGFKLNPLKRHVYVKESRNPYSEAGCRSYDLINSPVLAPVRSSTNNPRLSIIPRPELEECIVKFIKKQGGYDVIHFHSLEGINPQVLKALKEAFPNTRLLYSAHDYHPFCIGIRLYKNRTQFRCEGFNDGLDCIGCIHSFSAHELRRHILHYYRDPYNKVSCLGFLRKFLIRRTANKNYQKIHETDGCAKDYLDYRQTFVSYLNNYLDGVLAVSKRVGQIYEEMGINPNLITTSYIGTKVADKQIGHQMTPVSMPLSLLFMGSGVDPEKGLSFLLNALAKLPPETAGKLHFTIAAAGSNPEQVQKCLSAFNGYKVYHGYTHDQLPEILQSVHLGIVPVLWEDNLPQVALEMVAHGIPVLASDAGGAQELTECEHFRFRCGDESDLIEKLTYIINRPELMNEYWKTHKGLTTMQQHVEQLEFIYRQK